MVVIIKRRWREAQGPAGSHPLAGPLASVLDPWSPGAPLLYPGWAGVVVTEMLMGRWLPRLLLCISITSTWFGGGEEPGSGAPPVCFSSPGQLWGGGEGAQPQWLCPGRFVPLCPPLQPEAGRRRRGELS